METTQSNMPNYSQIAKDSRIKCLELVYLAGTSHIGSLMGCADIFAVLFEKIDLDKDKFILSAGWKACMLYYHLWRKGRITLKELNSYCQDGSKWIGLAEPVHKDIPFAGGSMGMGIAAGVGFALSKKLKKEKGKIYILESDGAMNVGISWEAIMIASHHKLNNIILIIEDNGFQAMGKTEDILNMEPLGEKLKAFGWEVREVNGHNYTTLEQAITYPPLYPDKPIAIIAKTIKGKGVSFMENQNIYHYLKVDDKDYKLALKELNIYEKGI